MTKADPVEKVLKTVRYYEMVKPGDIMLAAVSGGPDSVLLVHALNKLKKKLGIQHLAVCNLDHGLRGSESSEDSVFVKKYASNLGLEYIHKKVEIKKLKAKGISIEEAAREARYKFFSEAAKKACATVIATGHTLDDQAETVLMRIIKGSSLKGIVGISPARSEGAVRLIRPLIELEKSEIVRYLDENDIQYRIDSSNLEPVYFRNVVRSEIIPFLEKYNPRLKRVLSNLAEHLREDFEYIAGEKARIGCEIAHAAGSGIEIKLKDIAVQPRAIQKEILRDSLEKAGGEVKKLSFKHWKEIEGLIRRKNKGNSVDLPGSIRAKRTESSIVFSKLQ